MNNNVRAHNFITEQLELFHKCLDNWPALAWYLQCSFATNHKQSMLHVYPFIVCCSCIDTYFSKRKALHVYSQIILSTGLVTRTEQTSVKLCVAQLRKARKATSFLVQLVCAMKAQTQQFPFGKTL